MSRKNKPAKVRALKRKSRRRSSDSSRTAPLPTSTHSQVAQALQMALQQHREGHFDVATSMYQEILRVAPQNADAHHLLGVVAHQRGDHELAIDHISKAISIDAAAADFHLNLGSAHQSLGQLEIAIRSFRRCLELDPQSAIAHNNLGNALRGMDQIRSALEHYREAIRRQPDYAEAHSNLGVALSECGDLRTAQASLQRALDLNPKLVEAHSNLGIVLSKLGESEQAVHRYCQALSLAPNLAQVWSNLGHLLRNEGKLVDAQAAYERVAELRPELLWKLRPALLCPIVPRSNEEIETYRHQLETAITQFEGTTLVHSVDELSSSGGEPPFYLAYQGHNDRALKSSYAKLFSNLFPRIKNSRHDGPVHVAFVVSHRRERVFLRFLRGILNRLATDELRVSIVCSQAGRAILTKAIADERVGYIPIPHQLHGAAATIRDAAVDVLFYFEVGTDSMNYFLPFLQAAPVQCTSWGVPVTTGLPHLHYYLSSDLLEPAGSDDHYSETLVKFSTLPVYYERPAPSPTSRRRDAYGFADTDHLYLCPQSLFKFHPDFDQALAGILRRDPAARILLIDSGQRQALQLLVQRFRQTLPDLVQRLHFLPRQHHEEFVGLMQCCDVVLDTFPFGGGATTYEALALGMPLVTWPAAFMRGRVTTGCYRKMGVMDCVASSLQGYVDRAVRLGTDGDYRRCVHAKILSAKDVLYEDSSAVEELRSFLLHTAYSARAESGEPHAHCTAG